MVISIIFESLKNPSFIVILATNIFKFYKFATPDIEIILCFICRACHRFPYLHVKASVKWSFPNIRLEVVETETVLSILTFEWAAEMLICCNFSSYFLNHPHIQFRKHFGNCLHCRKWVTWWYCSF